MSESSPANAASMCGRVASEQWMSPAAAIRRHVVVLVMGVAMRPVYHAAAISTHARRVAAAP
jgi:hypothetical protein